MKRILAYTSFPNELVPKRRVSLDISGRDQSLIGVKLDEVESAFTALDNARQATGGGAQEKAFQTNSTGAVTNLQYAAGTITVNVGSRRVSVDPQSGTASETGAADTTLPAPPTPERLSAVLRGASPKDYLETLGSGGDFGWDSARIRDMASEPLRCTNPNGSDVRFTIAQDNNQTTSRSASAYELKIGAVGATSASKTTLFSTNTYRITEANLHQTPVGRGTVLVTGEVKGETYGSPPQAQPAAKVFALACADGTIISQSDIEAQMVAAPRSRAGVMVLGQTLVFINGNNVKTVDLPQSVNPQQVTDLKEFEDNLVVKCLAKDGTEMATVVNPNTDPMTVVVPVTSAPAISIGDDGNLYYVESTGGVNHTLKWIPVQARGAAHQLWARIRTQFEALGLDALIGAPARTASLSTTDQAKALATALEEKADGLRPEVNNTTERQELKALVDALDAARTEIIRITDGLDQAEQLRSTAGASIDALEQGYTDDFTSGFGGDPLPATIATPADAHTASAFLQRAQVRVINLASSQAGLDANLRSTGQAARADQAQAFLRQRQVDLNNTRLQLAGFAANQLGDGSGDPPLLTALEGLEADIAAVDEDNLQQLEALKPHLDAALHGVETLAVIFRRDHPTEDPLLPYVDATANPPVIDPRFDPLRAIAQEHIIEARSGTVGDMGVRVKALYDRQEDNCYDRDKLVELKEQRTSRRASFTAAARRLERNPDPKQDDIDQLRRIQNETILALQDDQRDKGLEGKSVGDAVVRELSTELEQEFARVEGLALAAIEHGLKLREGALGEALEALAKKLGQCTNLNELDAQIDGWDLKRGTSTDPCADALKPAMRQVQKIKEDAGEHAFRIALAQVRETVRRREEQLAFARIAQGENIDLSMPAYVAASPAAQQFESIGGLVQTTRSPNPPRALEVGLKPVGEPGNRRLMMHLDGLPGKSRELTGAAERRLLETFEYETATLPRELVFADLILTATFHPERKMEVDFVGLVEIVEETSNTEAERKDELREVVEEILKRWGAKRHEGKEGGNSGCTFDEEQLDGTVDILYACLERMSTATWDRTATTPYPDDDTDIEITGLRIDHDAMDVDVVPSGQAPAWPGGKLTITLKELQKKMKSFTGQRFGEPARVDKLLQLRRSTGDVEAAIKDEIGYHTLVHNEAEAIPRGVVPTFRDMYFLRQILQDLQNIADGTSSKGFVLITSLPGEGKNVLAALLCWLLNKRGVRIPGNIFGVLKGINPEEKDAEGRYIYSEEVRHALAALLFAQTELGSESVTIFDEYPLASDEFRKLGMTPYESPDGRFPIAKAESALDPTKDRYNGGRRGGSPMLAFGNLRYFGEESNVSDAEDSRAETRSLNAFTKQFPKLHEMRFVEICVGDLPLRFEVKQQMLWHMHMDGEDFATIIAKEPFKSLDATDLDTCYKAIRLRLRAAEKMTLLTLRTIDTQEMKNKRKKAACALDFGGPRTVGTIFARITDNLSDAEADQILHDELIRVSSGLKTDPDAIRLTKLHIKDVMSGATDEERSHNGGPFMTAAELQELKDADRVADERSQLVADGDHAAEGASALRTMASNLSGLPGALSGAINQAGTPQAELDAMRQAQQHNAALIATLAEKVTQLVDGDTQRTAQQALREAQLTASLEQQGKILTALTTTLARAGVVQGGGGQPAAAPAPTARRQPAPASAPAPAGRSRRTRT